MKNEGALRMRFIRHDGIYRSDVSSFLFTPGACPAFRSGRCQGIGQAGKNLPCPSSAMSSGRPFLDGLLASTARLRFNRHDQHKTIAASKGMIYHRTANSLLTVCLTRGDKRSSPVFTHGGCQPVMHHGGSHHADPGVVMLVVIPGERFGAPD